MIEQKTGIPEADQDLIPDGCPTPMHEGCRLCHYAEVLFRSERRITLVRRPGSSATSIDRATVSRLRKELQNAQNQQSSVGYTLEANRSDEVAPLKWRASITGPPEGPYAGGTFDLDIVLPRDYPYRPPRVLFTTPIFHPLVASTGSIDLAVLHEAWSPVITLSVLVCHIRREMEAPYNHVSASSPCLGCGNHDAARLSLDNEAFDERARQETLAHAVRSPPSP